MENIQNKVISLICICLLIAGGLYLHNNIEFETVEVKLPPDTKVINNPYYAAQELLKTSGYQIYGQADYSLSTLPEQSTLLALNPESIKKDNQSLQIEAWVKNGGHLVLGVGRTSYYSLPDFLNIKANRRISSECAKPRDRKSCRDELTVNSAKLNASMNGLTAFTIGEKKTWAIPSQRNKKRQLVARYSLGSGTVTVVQSEWFKNNTISQFDHAKLLIELTTLSKQNRPIYLLEYGAYPNIFTWLAEHAFYTVVSFIGLIVFMLWHFMPRFGTLLSEQRPHRPHLIEHIAAIGRYQINKRNYDALLRPFHNEIKMLIEPFKLYYPDITTQERLISRITQLNHADVVKIMNNQTESQTEFTQQVALLDNIIKRIKQAKQPNLQGTN